MTKGSVHQVKITITNVCVPNKRASKYIKEQKGKIKKDNFTITGRDNNLSANDKDKKNCLRKIPSTIFNCYLYHNTTNKYKPCACFQVLTQ